MPGTANKERTLVGESLAVDASKTDFYIDEREREREHSKARNLHDEKAALLLDVVTRLRTRG